MFKDPKAKGRIGQAWRDTAAQIMLVKREMVKKPDVLAGENVTLWFGNF